MGDSAVIDPTDDVLDIYRRGDADVMPTASGGVDGSQAVTDYEASSAKAPRMFRPQLVTLAALNAAGDRTAVSVGDTPEYWSITGLTSPNTNTEAWIWCGRAPEGPPSAILTGTGSAKIAGAIGGGNGYALWIENRGSAAMRILVRAVRGYDFVENIY